MENSYQTNEVNDDTKERVVYLVVDGMRMRLDGRGSQCLLIPHRPSL